MNNKYSYLFSPGKIGKVVIRNRSVMTGMGVGLGQENGCVTEKEYAYLTKRAKGGVGLIITGIMRVEEESGISFSKQLSASNDMHIQGLRRLADSIHHNGAVIFGQLQHPGNTADPNLNDRVLSPSGISAANGVPTESLSIDEIHQLVLDFGEAALRLKKAGFDGVEVHGAHFYLIHQFLSPTYNHRTDMYGGSSENRFRFLKEIIEEIRNKCGTDFPIIVRVSLEEYIGESGYHPDYGITICKRLEQIGVDGLDITASGSASPRGQSIEYLTYEQGWRRFLIKAVKRCVDIPVIGVCVIRSPAYAEEMLAVKDADFIGSGRNHLADPEWENKVENGVEEMIRPCISCLRCVENLKNGKSAYCSVNPTCGKEDEERPLLVNGDGRLVIVLGAGPAGLEASMIAAQRGFHVILFEKDNHVGGQIYLAAQVPGKTKMNWIISWMEKSCKNAGVELKLNESPSEEELRLLHPYAVIDASGGMPLIPASIHGTDRPNVCTPQDILSGRIRPVGENVLIVGSGMTGLETAEYLTQIPGVSVMVMEMNQNIAPTAYIAAKEDALTRLLVHNVIMMTGRELIEIGEDRVYFKEIISGEKRELPVDRVVMSLGVKSSGAYIDLESVCNHVAIIGDANKPARIQEAISSGYEAAIAI